MDRNGGGCSCVCTLVGVEVRAGERCLATGLCWRPHELVGGVGGMGCWWWLEEWDRLEMGEGDGHT